MCENIKIYIGDNMKMQTIQIKKCKRVCKESKYIYKKP